MTFPDFPWLADNATESQRRGALIVHARITARLDEEYAAHGDVLQAVATVTGEEVRAVAAHGYPVSVQEVARAIVAYTAAPIVAAALAAESIPDTPACLL